MSLGFRRTNNGADSTQDVLDHGDSTHQPAWRAGPNVQLLYDTLSSVSQMTALDPTHLYLALYMFRSSGVFAGQRI